jgi:hypothetical protein
MRNQKCVLFNCQFIRDSWNVAGLNEVVQQRLQWCGSVVKLLSKVCSKEDINVVGRVAVHLWYLWQNCKVTKCGMILLLMWFNWTSIVLYVASMVWCPTIVAEYQFTRDQKRCCEMEETDGWVAQMQCWCCFYQHLNKTRQHVAFVIATKILLSLKPLGSTLLYLSSKEKV